LGDSNCERELNFVRGGYTDGALKRLVDKETCTLGSLEMTGTSPMSAQVVAGGRQTRLSRERVESILRPSPSGETGRWMRSHSVWHAWK
jgi:hypothetical protein